MIRSILRVNSSCALAGLLGCAPLLRVTLGFKPPQPETTASQLAYAQALGLPPAQVALARPAFVLDHRRDTLLYANPNANRGLYIGGGKVQR
ncbi:hypothetical protein LJ737_07600 [Hymenobacter sp. 15J16-1T3B]|uniref:hypothetical protein n=1 Tax=Hymenobacter sp. 15J16-1T3B TaxID=2886941 RepID=UPI001D0FBD8B|nr:hypothetical protein [Hymenobacter sp. 15J16-1T3B]MCC3157098.1 hypothetical protein [Hymenobacter sp. 15J16-1T3B]